jgi:hypothetical protein
VKAQRAGLKKTRAGAACGRDLDLRPVLKVRPGAGVIVGLDRDVLDADMLFVISGRHVKLHAVQVELALIRDVMAAADVGAL